MAKKRKNLALGSKDPPLQLPLATTKLMGMGEHSEEPSLWAESSPVIARYCSALSFAALYSLAS